MNRTIHLPGYRLSLNTLIDHRLDLLQNKPRRTQRLPAGREKVRPSPPAFCDNAVGYCKELGELVGGEDGHFFSKNSGHAQLTQGQPAAAGWPHTQWVLDSPQR
jgi:hypothetical protein